MGGRLVTLAVTGTNGKTTATRMLGAIARAAGAKAAVVTTVGVAMDGEERGQLPPDMDSFRAFVRDVRAEGADVLCLEVTSRALAGGFAERWPPSHAALTSFSRDHLDRHGSLEEYLAAKARLFLALPEGGTAALPAGSEAADLIDEVLSPGVRRVRFGLGAPGAELRGRVEGIEPEGTRLAMVGLVDGPVRLRMHGAPFAVDALAAAALAQAQGFGDDAVRGGLEAFEGVAGRFEIVGRHPLVAVDFAHTPEALQATLETARALVGPGGRLRLVFGCGGERDQGKRPQMGAIASTFADDVVLTTDNPRGEDSAAIAAGVRAGRTGESSSWDELPDRTKAIETTISRAKSPDVVLVAGKGHEAEQIEGSLRRPFDDRQVARRALARRSTDH